MDGFDNKEIISPYRYEIMHVNDQNVKMVKWESKLKMRVAMVSLIKTDTKYIMNSSMGTKSSISRERAGSSSTQSGCQGTLNTC